MPPSRVLCQFRASHIRRRRGYVLPGLRRALAVAASSSTFLSWRDLKVRYAQTVLGAAWTLIQPVALMLVFTYAFSRLGNVQTEGVPYPVFALAGITFWTFFARAVTQGSDSLVQNAPLLTKIYCPRLLIPALVGRVCARGPRAEHRLADRRRPRMYGYLPDLAPRAPRASRARGLPPRGRRARSFSRRSTFASGTYEQGLPFLVMLGLFVSPVAYPLDNPALRPQPARRNHRRLPLVLPRHIRFRR